VSRVFLGTGACALQNGGGVVCWSDPPATQSLLKIPIADAVSVGDGCALRQGGRVSCWGYMVGKPVDVPDLASTASIDRVCAARSDGTVVCAQTSWLFDTELPHVVVASLNDAKQVSGTTRLGCAVRATRQVVCWGDNTRGQLGDGTYEARSAAVTVVGIADAVQVSVGSSDDHACALHADGHVSCWGSAMAGGLGNGEHFTDRVGPTFLMLR
jgi:hypothetical protein